MQRRDWRFDALKMGLSVVMTTAHITQGLDAVDPEHVVHRPSVWLVPAFVGAAFGVPILLAYSGMNLGHAVRGRRASSVVAVAWKRVRRHAVFVWTSAAASVLLLLSDPVGQAVPHWSTIASWFCMTSTVGTHMQILGNIGSLWCGQMWSSVVDVHAHLMVALLAACQRRPAFDHNVPLSIGIVVVWRIGSVLWNAPCSVRLPQMPELTIAPTTRTSMTAYSRWETNVQSVSCPDLTLDTHMALLASDYFGSVSRVLPFFVGAWIDDTVSKRSTADAWRHIGIARRLALLTTLVLALYEGWYAPGTPLFVAGLFLCDTMGPLAVLPTLRMHQPRHHAPWWMPGATELVPWVHALHMPAIGWWLAS